MGLALLSCDRELPTITRDPRSGARGEDWKAVRLVLPGRQLVCGSSLTAVKTVRRHTHCVSSCTCTRSCALAVVRWMPLIAAAQWCRNTALVGLASRRVGVPRPRPGTAG